ncbi:MAG: hypothetical protein LUD68_10840, partial [Rikenellaceae bacterium]|nr:hypothetical protein [Rikenellaceae bacterium]
TSSVDPDGSFAFAFYPQPEGFYGLGIQPQQSKNRYAFYFKPGDRLSFRVTDTGYELAGKNTPENQEMARWQQFVEPLDNKLFAYTEADAMSTYIDFFPLFEEREQALAQYPVVKTKNAAFDEIFPRYRNLDFLGKASTYIFAPRTAHPQGEDYPDYFRSLDMVSLGREPLLLNYPEGVRLYAQVPMLRIMADPELSPQERSAKLSGGPEALLLADEELMEQIDAVLRGELTVMYARNKRNIEAFNLYDEKFGRYVLTEQQKQAYAEIRNPLAKTNPVTAATDFAFHDQEGNRVALSDFQGKVVYVDV